MLKLKPHFIERPHLKQTNIKSDVLEQLLPALVAMQQTQQEIL